MLEGWVSQKEINLLQCKGKNYKNKKLPSHYVFFETDIFWRRHRKMKFTRCAFALVNVISNLHFDHLQMLNVFTSRFYRWKLLHMLELMAREISHSIVKFTFPQELQVICCTASSDINLNINIPKKSPTLVSIKGI